MKQENNSYYFAKTLKSFGKYPILNVDHYNPRMERGVNYAYRGLYTSAAGIQIYLYR